nr:amino acid transporter [Ancylobacter crimeensis]
MIHNERTKLTALYLNGLSIALFAVGAVGPVISVMNEPASTRTPFIGLVAGVCILSSGALHYAARYVLGRLRP